MLSSHTNLQYYRHNYGQVFITGMVGCRWHRYKQNLAGSRKRDIAWLLVLTVTFLCTVFWFYFTLISQNDRHNFNWYMRTLLKQWWSWYSLLLAIVSVLFSYIVIIELLAVCHIQYGHQVYIHPLHKCLMVLVMAVCVTLTVCVEQKWPSQWGLILISLHMFGPFLQVGSVCILTCVSWIFIKQWLHLPYSYIKAITAVIYVGIMASFYLSPLLINSPCVIDIHQLPRQPALGAHRGAAALAPENTLVSFEIASRYPFVEVLETNVHISYDGIPFLLHDRDLRYTTNIEDKFPELAHLAPSQLNMSQLQALSAGSWFIKYDPWGRVGQLSMKDISLYQNQSVPQLLDVLSIAHRHNLSVLLHLNPLPPGHPYSNNATQIIIETIDSSEIDRHKIYWPSDGPGPPENVTLVSSQIDSVERLISNNISVIIMANQYISHQDLRLYQDHNISVQMYIVNEEWLYSFYWCVGVDLVYTDRCNDLGQMEEPVWHMSPGGYLALWVTVDLLSMGILAVFLFVLRSRLPGNSCQVDQVSVGTVSNTSGGMWRHKNTRRSMKEKLLMREVAGEMYDFEPEEELGIESTGYDLTVTASEGRLLSQAFHSNRNSYTSNEATSVANRYSCNGSAVETDAYSVTGGNGDVSNVKNSLHSNQLSCPRNVETTLYQGETERVET